MSFSPAPMRRLRMVVLDRDARRVTAVLGRLGVMHLLEARVEDVPESLRRVNRNEDLERCRALLGRIENLRDRLGLAALPAPGPDGEEPLDRAEARVTEMEARLKPVLARREALASESERLQDEHARLSSLTFLDAPLTRVVDSPFLYLFVGSIPEADVAAVRAEARADVVLIEMPLDARRRQLAALTPRRGRFALDTLLRRNNFTPEDLAGLPMGVPAQLLPEIEKRLAEIRAQQEEAGREMQALAEELRPTLVEWHGRLRLELAVLEASANFAHTDSACLMDGWAPSAAVPAVIRKTLEATGGRAVILAHTPEEAGAPSAEVPVLLRNNRFFRPFELLVTTYGLPRYRDVDPTLIVGLSFLLMYGLMFGDVGHGALLALAGAGLWRFMKDRALRDLGVIVLWAGAASVLCGFLYGSLFGIDVEALSVLAHVGSLHWEGPLSQPMYLLTAPILIGVFMVAAGMTANLANRVRNGDASGGLLDRFGGMGLVFYAAALLITAAAWRFGGGRWVWIAAAVFLAGPLLVLFLKEIVHRVLHPSKDEGLAMAAVNGAFEVMETLMSFLTNTVSFSRVGAFALAHGGLSLAVYTLAEIVRGAPGGVLWGAAAVALGNLLILALEGLIVFVQCMRLEYYEFFSKFFEGGGKRYSPFRVG